MRILFLTQFFPPEIGAPQTRILETAQCLRDRGHEVAVLTTRPNYPSGVVPPEYRAGFLMQESLSGIPVVRTWLYATANRGFLRRTLSHISFSLTAFWGARRLPWKPDVISVDMHPLFLCLTARVLGWLWQVPYVLNAGDLIPDQAIAYGVMRNPFAIRLSRWLAASALDHASQIVPFTRGIHDELLRRGIASSRLQLIYFGADILLLTATQPATKAARLPGDLDGAFVMTYAGTHGLPHGLRVVLDAAQRLAGVSDVRFILAGDGGEKRHLVESARRLALDNVTFIDPLPRGELPTLYQRSDACLVTLKRSDWLRQFALSSKVFDVMAAGRPVIAAAEGETAEFVARSRAGICIPPEDPDALVEAILRIKANPELAQQYGENGRAYVATHLSREQQSRRYEAVLQRAIDSWAQRGKGDERDRARKSSL